MLPQRLPAKPDLPTAAETIPGLTAIGWQAVAVRTGTPASIVAQLGEDLRRTMEVQKLARASIRSERRSIRFTAPTWRASSSANRSSGGRS